MLGILGCLPKSAKSEDIACFYALDADLAALQKDGRPVGTPKAVGGQQVTMIQLAAHRVYAVKMGSGCLQTAIAAASVLARFPCDLAISVGPAGRLSDQLAVGEWRRVSEVVSYQQGSETKAGFVLGQNAVRKLGDQREAALPKSLQVAPARLASGELFIASNLYRDQLQALTGASCVDMNLAGLAAACTEAKVPLLAWKIISDSANDSASVDFQAFVKTYDGEGGRRIAELVRKLPENPDKPASYKNLNRLLESGRPEN